MRPLSKISGSLLLAACLGILTSAQDEPLRDSLRHPAGRPAHQRSRQSGKLVTNLPKETFKVFENNIEQQVSDFPAGGYSRLHRHHRGQQRQHAREAAEGGSRCPRAGEGLQQARRSLSSSTSTTTPTSTCRSPMTSTRWKRVSPGSTPRAGRPCATPSRCRSTT